MSKINNKKSNSLLYSNRFIFLSFLATAGTMLIIYLITQVFPFGDQTVLRMDLYHRYGPLFAELYDKLFSKDTLNYSWTSGLGSCFLGNYFNYLSSPIGAIIVFFGHKNIPEAIGAMVLIKAALSASTFSYYLKKSQKSHSAASVSFSMFYAFCSYMLAYYWNVMWLDAMILLPVILLGIENIIDHGKIWHYVVGLSLSMFSNYYMSFMLCMFAVVYFCYYYISHYSMSSVLKENYEDEVKFKKLKNSRFFRSGVIFALSSFLSAGIMAFALLPTLSILSNCSATSGTFPTDYKTYFGFFDFFANHLPGLETTIRSSGDDVLPNIYCGLLTVILAPLYFFSKTISKKEKTATIGLLGFFFISFNFNIFNYIWHGFHYPNDLPYRYSFMYSFILLIMAFKVFRRLNEFTTRQIAVVGVSVMAFAVIISKVGSKNFDDACTYIVLIFSVVYILLLSVLKDKRYEAASVAVLLAVCVCSEVIIADTQSFPNNVTKSSYESDYEDFRLIKEHLDLVEGHDDYRMELSSLRTRMDPSWFGYNGVSVFSSMAYEKLSRLQDRLGLMSNGINSYTYNPQTPVYNMMHSLEYIVNNETPCVLSDRYYTHMTDVNNFSAYSFNYALPIAYCVNNEITQWYYQDDKDSYSINPFEVQGDYFDKATGVGNPFEKVSVSYVTYNNTEPFYNSLDSNFYSYRKIDSDALASAIFNVTMQKEGNLYIYFKIDGASQEHISVTSSLGTFTHDAGQDCVLDLGRYKKDETVSITLPFESASGNARFYIYTMNDEIFEKGYEILSGRALSVESFETDEITGRFTAKEDCILYSSIPYDKGWKVNIDGKEVSKEDIVAIGDALLGIKVQKGNHDIVFKYEPTNLTAGTVISVFSLVILALLIILSVTKKKFITKKLPSFEVVDSSFDEELFTAFEADEIQNEINVDENKEAMAEPVKERVPPYKTGRVELEIIYPRKEIKVIRPEVILPPQRFTVTESVFDTNGDSEET